MGEPDRVAEARNSRTAVTSAEVARAAGVSRAAVSQILNGRGQRFSAATRERVEEVARSLAYQPSAAARMLVSGTSDLVVAVVPNTTYGAHLQDMVDVLTGDLAAVGLTLVLRFSTSSPESFDKLIAGMRPVAVLPLGPLSAEELQVLAARRVALVGAGRGSVTAGEDPNHAIGALQAEHLVARGHRRLAFAHLSDARQDPYGRGRLQGFRDRSRELGRAEPSAFSVGIDVDDAVRELQRLDAPGVAIAAYNDDVALTLVGAAQRLGWRIPEDLAVIGVDNIPLGRVFVPRLTTVAYDSAAIAHAMARAVLAAVFEDDPGSPVRTDLSVIEGETT